MKLEATFMLLAAAVVGFFTGALWTADEPVLSVLAALFLGVPILFLTELIDVWALEQRMRERLRR